jgi:hypothetical protein
MVSHQDVTALRQVEGELGRIQMKEQTNKGLMAHDSDVAGSLLTLLGENSEMLLEERNLTRAGGQGYEREREKERERDRGGERGCGLGHEISPLV